MTNQPSTNQPDPGAVVWRDYVLSVAEGDSQKEISRHTGVDQGTVSRWIQPRPGKGNQRPGPESVKKFARGYKRDILEAFVAAGLVTAEEVGVRVEARALAQYTNDELIRVLRNVTVELSRRLVVT
jgi:transcriptional regulator with XRE-family HTH domain